VSSTDGGGGIGVGGLGGFGGDGRIEDGTDLETRGAQPGVTDGATGCGGFGCAAGRAVYREKVGSRCAGHPVLCSGTSGFAGG